MDPSNQQYPPYPAEQRIAPPPPEYAQQHVLLPPLQQLQPGWPPAGGPPGVSSSSTGPDAYAYPSYPVYQAPYADNVAHYQQPHPNYEHAAQYSRSHEHDPQDSVALDLDPEAVAAVTDEAIAALLANMNDDPPVLGDGPVDDPARSSDGEGLDPFSALQQALSTIPSPPQQPLPEPSPPPPPPKRRGRGPGKKTLARLAAQAAAAQPQPKVLERVGRSGRMTVKTSYNELDDNDDEFLMSESEDESRGSRAGSSVTSHQPGEAAAPRGRGRRGGRPKGVSGQPRATKVKPKSVVIAEIQINGVWVPHIPDADGNLVPCDKRGEPLVQPAGQDGSAGPDPVNAEASSSSAAAAAVAAGRAKRKRANAAAYLSSPDPEDRLSGGSDFESIDGSSDDGSKPVKKKVGAKSAAEKRAIAAREEKRLRKERAKDSERMAKDGTYAIENFGVGEEGRDRAMLNEGYHDLRDTVPALRLLFDAQAPFDPLTDLPHPVTNLIDGLPPLTSQNGKLSILTASTAYIPLLAHERDHLTWHAHTLEDFVRKIDGGEAAWRKWRGGFDKSEEVHGRHALGSPPPLEEMEMELGGGGEIGTMGAAPASSLSTSNPLNPPSPTTATFLKPPGAAGAPRTVVPSSPDLGSSSVKLEEGQEVGGRGSMSRAQSEVIKDRNRKKQRLFRERQKTAIAALEAQIRAVQGQMMGTEGVEGQ